MSNENIINFLEGAAKVKTKKSESSAEEKFRAATTMEEAKSSMLEMMKDLPEGVQKVNVLSMMYTKQFMDFLHDKSRVKAATMSVIGGGDPKDATVGGIAEAMNVDMDNDDVLEDTLKEVLYSVLKEESDLQDEQLLKMYVSVLPYLEKGKQSNNERVVVVSITTTVVENLMERELLSTKEARILLTSLGKLMTKGE